MHGNSKMKKTTDEKKPSYKKETGGQKIFKYDIEIFLPFWPIIMTQIFAYPRKQLF